ncbi:MAG TPA: helix-turn-helix domain-containing protein [Solirubrobacteraceae bacterium]|nr:helix-turn-helix domain-containing protein [Solirubrobacteraceae bacterium]
MPSRVWRAEQLPPEAVAAVRSQLPYLVENIVDAVRAETPAYGDVLAGPEGMAIRVGIEQAHRAFLAALERGERPAGETDELWRALGEAEFQSGRSLDELRAAFRVGTRAAWRGAADMALQAGVSAPMAIATAEAIFVYADELAADVVEGYLRMQSDEAGERERRRRRVAALLLDPDGHDPEALARAAELARWPLPRTLAAIAVAAEAPPAAVRRLDADVLAGADGEGTWLIVSDPEGPGRRAAIEHALAAERAAVGPAVAPEQAARSLRWARAALALATERAPAGEGTLIHAGDHLATLIVRQDAELARALVDRVLAPLDSLTAAERDRLRETLRAWLDLQRHTPQIAQRLHVHPQTVRYRMAKLEELLGDGLRTAEGRFALAVALRVPPALRADTRPSPRGPGL